MSAPHTLCLFRRRTVEQALRDSGSPIGGPYDGGLHPVAEEAIQTLDGLCEDRRVGQPQILDACCGGRHWWWDKGHPLAIYMDERVVPLGNEWRATWACDPDVVGDFRAMPFEDESFQLVLFDPPHIVRKNLETKWSTRFYGALNPDTWQDDLRRGFAECWRVLNAGGSLVFKWSGDTSRCSPYFPAEPIVGTRGSTETSWFIFYKPVTL